MFSAIRRVTHRAPALKPFRVSAGAAQNVRWLNLHEYQSKGLMDKYGVRVQKSFTATTEAEALKAANDLKAAGAEDLIVKAQILAGGRGKGTFKDGFKGGVHVLQDPAKAGEAAGKMLNNVLVTKQTGEAGQLCSKVLIHEGVDFDREFYFALLLDRSYGGPVMVGSPMGGMDIEEVAENSPEAIHTIPIDIHKGIQANQTEEMAKFMGFEGESIKDAQTQIKGLYDMFISEDSTQVEINPLVMTSPDSRTKGKVFCVDAKIGFDDNAQFRHKDLFAMRDTSMEDSREVEATENDLNYIQLDGNIGCLVNGAGLAMATMDIIKMHGASPANFLDVGGSASEEQVTQAFKILTSDDQVKAILVNIFGGIMHCDVIAKGIVGAAKHMELKIPLVVRLEGTNVEDGKRILAESGINVITADDLDDAATKVAASIK